METAVLICLAGVNLALFFLMGADKRAARKRLRRTPETTLLALAVLGGACGGLLGMLLFRHKTRKPAFSFGLPALLALQLGLAWLLLR